VNDNIKKPHPHPHPVVAAMVEDEVKALREPKEPIVYKTRRVGRNEKCRCGSGRKFKQCHLNTVVRL
jgi:uncharacterized protein YecA (UPF0149 family)